MYALRGARFRAAAVDEIGPNLDSPIAEVIFLIGAERDALAALVNRVARAAEYCFYSTHAVSVVDDDLTLRYTHLRSSYLKPNKEYMDAAEFGAAPSARHCSAETAGAADPPAGAADAHTVVSLVTRPRGSRAWKSVLAVLSCAPGPAERAGPAPRVLANPHLAREGGDDAAFRSAALLAALGAEIARLTANPFLEPGAPRAARELDLARFAPRRGYVAPRVYVAERHAPFCRQLLTFRYDREPLRAFAFAWFAGQLGGDRAENERIEKAYNELAHDLEKVPAAPAVRDLVPP
ncbi:virion core protein [Nile crocodilepox virus]|uniref:Virion core protein n=1 Tax=Nile crocodilepox virus (isolate Crocodylus niloticus/Zimbabwe/Ume/2001) TaxID=1289473 RepID=Q070E0_CPRVZ|nr:virion core protein [Nile crocodilepox virus]ABJ09001.1 virion core protein [Nile crocodilepox virus]